ncbi:MAG: hypothetical protein PHY25_03450, partial [Dehalococcoidales bacterium]|nr:hypothetical protein [Dehalococcoidales bacterium]
MTAHILQFQHITSQLLYGYMVILLCDRILADLVILAIHTRQIAVTKKDSTRTSGAGNYRFLTMMITKTGHNRFLTTVAISTPLLMPLYIISAARPHTIRNGISRFVRMPPS